MFTQPLMIGSTYRLKFKSLFERHGVCTTPGVTCLHKGGGVFRLEQITNFRDVVYGGIKLYDVFFKPLGISELDYRNYFDDKPADEYEPEYSTKEVSNIVGDFESTSTADGRLTTRPIKRIVKHEVHVETGKSILKRHVKDKVNYASYPIYKFVDVVDANDMIWVPELTIAEFPEVDIREYRDLSLVIHLGFTHDPATLDPMLLSIRERMAAFGWRPSLIRMYATATKWMSPAEYDAIKKIRIPATIETITSDGDDIKNGKATQMRKAVLGDMVIENGFLKKIVEPGLDGKVNDPASEISVDAIARHEQVLDNRLFLTKCDDSELFEKDEQYYVEVQLPYRQGSVDKIAPGHKMLREGYDYAVGDPCVAYEPASNETVLDIANNWDTTTTKLYVKNPGVWNPIPYGHNADYDRNSLYMRIGTETFRQIDQSVSSIRIEGKKYFIIEVDDFNNVSYREANANDFTEDGSLPADKSKFYTKEGDDTYTYRQPNDIEFANMSNVLYIKAPDTYSVAKSCPALDDDGNLLYPEMEYFLKTEVCKESYGTDRSLPLLGFKFDYNDVFNKPKTITLQLEDIIEAAAEQMNVVLPNSDLSDEFWGKFYGRKFRWVVKPDENDPTVTETLETVISEETKYLLSEKTGVLLGDSGTIYKEVYIRDNGKQKRNYYMQYVTQQKTLEEQKNRIAELESALLSMQQSNDELRLKNEELEEEIARLTPST